MKNKLLKFSSIFGVFAICALFCSTLFIKSKKVNQVSAYSDVLVGQTTFIGEHFNVPYNKLVNGSYQLTRDVDYEISYRASLFRRYDDNSTGYYVRIDISYIKLYTFVTLDTQVDAEFILGYSTINLDDEWMSRGGYSFSTDLLSSTTSYNFRLVLANAGIYNVWDGGGSPNIYGNHGTRYWETFRLVDNITGEVFFNSSFDVSASGYANPTGAWRDPYNYPENFRFNADGGTTPPGVSFGSFVFNANPDEYSLGYEAGYIAGSTDGYSVGFGAGQNSAIATNQYNIDHAYTNGYNAGVSDGYSQGYSEGLNGNSTISTIFSNIFLIGMLPVDFFLKILNFEVLGINIASFVSALLSVAVTVIVIRLVTGKKND